MDTSAIRINADSQLLINTENCGSSSFPITNVKQELSIDDASMQTITITRNQHQVKDPMIDIADDKTEITEVILMNGNEINTLKIDNASCEDPPNSSIVDGNISSFSLRIGSLKKYLVNHESPAFKPNYKCLKCEFLSNSPRLLVEHIKHVHYSELFSCQECSQLFLRKERYARHKYLYHGKGCSKEWKCKKCVFSCNDYNSYRSHLEKSHACKSFLCSVSGCGLQYKTKQGLINHVKMKHPQEKQISSSTYRVCKICGRAFGSIFELEKHSWTHTGMRPFSCSYCQYKCTSKSNLHRHKIHKHFYPTRLRCPHCSKKFYDEKLFQDHQNGHLVYQCLVCTFKASSQRIIHKHEIQCHNRTIKRFGCDNCSTKFVSKKNLRQHIRSSQCRKKSNASLNVNCESSELRVSKKKSNISAQKNDKSSELIKCNGCNEHFSKVKILEKHRKYCHFC